MEGYIKKMIFLGENIQTIRKHRKMKQQELADKIGINMQSLSKIERGVNYPTFDTLEKIMDVLGVTPNELLSGKWNMDTMITSLTAKKNGWSMSWNSCGNTSQTISTERRYKRPTFTLSRNLSST